MKRNRLIALSLLACTLLAGCDKEKTNIQKGGDPVGTVKAGDNSYSTNLDLQKFYEDLKTSNGGTVALEKLIERLASLEYSDENLANPSTDSTFDVKDYHTTASLQEEIAKKFEDIVDGSSYLDDDGKFDPKAYKKYIEDTFDYELEEGETSSKYIADATLRATLGYNYDKYIEEEIKPSILQDYIYLDYVTGSSKYKGQFANQYAVKFEVLKIANDTSKLNSDWTQSLISDVRKIVSAEENIQFNDNYSFVTFDALGNFIVFKSEANKLSFSIYTVSEADGEAYNPCLYTGKDTTPVEALDFVKDAATVATLANEANKLAEQSWEITPSEVANGEFYAKINSLLVARKLWAIDREVALARNADNKTTKFDAMTETEKTEAKGFASTYSSSNSKSIKDGAKSSKLSAQRVEYYSEPEYYTKSNYSSVLPSALTSLRGTSAKDLLTHVTTFGTDEENNSYLVPKRDVTNPVYLDTSGNNYYICEVYAYYGYYESVNILDSSKASKSISNYQIEAYQNGYYTTWKLNDNGTRYVEDTDAKVTYKDSPEKFEDIIQLVQKSATNILTSAIKKEAIVTLFEKYGLEINDQEIYDYINGQYPDYFSDSK